MNRKLKTMKIETKFRPHPFWSWNERLDTEETARQVRLMGEAGIGGFFMHARGGLQTPYMGEEWNDNIRAAIDAAKEYGMHPWVYDEDGWPSGFGGEIVSGMGVEYQQKYLQIEIGDRQCETTVCHAGGYHLYYEVKINYRGNVIRIKADKKTVSYTLILGKSIKFVSSGNKVELKKAGDKVTLSILAGES